MRTANRTARAAVVGAGFGDARLDLREIARTFSAVDGLSDDVRDIDTRQNRRWRSARIVGSQCLVAGRAARNEMDARVGSASRHAGTDLQSGWQPAEKVCRRHGGMLRHGKSGGRDERGVSRKAALAMDDVGAIENPREEVPISRRARTARNPNPVHAISTPTRISLSRNFEGGVEHAVETESALRADMDRRPARADARPAHPSRTGEGGHLAGVCTGLLSATNTQVRAPLVAACDGRMGRQFALAPASASHLFLTAGVVMQKARGEQHTARQPTGSRLRSELPARRWRRTACAWRSLVFMRNVEDSVDALRSGGTRPATSDAIANQTPESRPAAHGGRQVHCSDATQWSSSSSNSA